MAPRWAAAAGVAVPIIIALGSLLGRNSTMLSEHEIRIRDLESARQLLISEVLISREKDDSLGSRISTLEGKLDVIRAPPVILTDNRGKR